MKKISLLAFFLMVCLASNAQLRTGIKAGANIAFLAADNSQTTAAFHAGVMLQYKLGNMFAIQPEALFSMVREEGLNETINMSYASIPVLAQCYIVPRFYFEFGAYFNFLISNKNYKTINIFGSTSTVQLQHETSFMGACMGAGYELKSAPIGFSARYNTRRIIQLSAFVKF